MKYVKTTHYVEKSFEDKPSFIIVLKNTDNKEIPFISNGCQFVELNDKNIEKLIQDYDCKEYIDQLLESTLESTDNLKNVRHMFKGCTSLESVELSLPSATDCWGLLEGCTFSEDLIKFNYV